MTAARGLVVEDEYLVQLMLAELLAELGYDVVAVAANVKEGQQHAEQAKIDFALLDVNLGGEKVFPVADVLESRGIPFCFVTGYGTAGITPAHKTRPVLQKPFQKDDLARMLRHLVGKRSRVADQGQNARAR
jgi:CheY-like chemotaxis protein